MKTREELANILMTILVAANVARNRMDDPYLRASEILTTLLDEIALAVKS